MLVIDKIPDQCAKEHDAEGAIGIPKGKVCTCENLREKQHQDTGCGDDDPGYLAVEPALQRNDLIDGPLILLSQGLVQRNSDGCSNTQFGEVEKLQQTGGRRIEPEDLRPETVDENFSGDEGNQQVGSIENQRRRAVP